MAFITRNKPSERVNALANPKSYISITSFFKHLHLLTLSQSQINTSQSAYEKLLPPWVNKVRLAVARWRDESYQGASPTTKSLLKFWFQEKHLIEQKKFSFFFSQREAIESIIYLYEVPQAKDKHELIKFDSSERVSTGMFDET